MRNKIKDEKNIIIAALIVAVLFMSVGYAAFAQTLNVNGNAEITGEWSVEITKIEATQTLGTASAGNPTFTKTSATFDADLKAPGDSVTYTITVANNGNIDAELSSANFTPQADGSPAINYTTTEPSTTLNAGETTTFTVTATYDASYQQIPTITSKTITGVVEYVQAS